MSYIIVTCSSISSRRRCKTPSLSVCKFFGCLLLFQIISAIALAVSLLFFFTLERYGPRVLAQHIDDGKYVAVAAVETWIWTHLDNVSLPQIIISLNYDASSWKISFRWSVQLLYQSLFFGTFLLFRHILSQCMMESKWWRDSVHRLMFIAMSRLYTLFWSVVIFFSIWFELIFKCLHAFAMYDGEQMMERFSASSHLFIAMSRLYTLFWSVVIFFSIWFELIFKCLHALLHVV